jgi:hypothetical protein
VNLARHVSYEIEGLKRNYMQEYPYFDVMK